MEWYWLLALVICSGLILVRILVLALYSTGNSPSINICTSTSLSADISIIFVCRLVFILIFVLTLCVICIRTSHCVRLSNIANSFLIFDLYCFAHIFIRVCISKHGRTRIGTNLCTNALELTRVFVSI